MSARRTPALAVALALALSAGCKSTSAKPGPHLAGPAGVALFVGVTARSVTDPHPYLAIPNLRGDDLRIIDPIDGAAVLAPTLVLSLSVPTEASPSLVAAGSLADLDAQGKALVRPDLLVVASTGTSGCPSRHDPTGAGRLSGCIQVVQTWAEPDGTILTRVVDDLAIPLAEVTGAEDAVVRAVAVLPVTDAAGVVVHGKARLAAALAGGRLLLADFARTAVAGAGLAIVADGAPAVIGLGFDVRSLSPAPGGARLYAASTDLLPAATPVHGVAELDVSGPLSATPRWRALDAGGPTTVVLAASVRRFTGFRTSSTDSTWDPTRDLHGAEVLRLYAARQAGSCGPTQAVTCGLAVLDPSGGGADGTGGLALETAASGPTADRFQAGIPIPGNVVALAAIPPPTVGGICDDGTSAPCAAATNPLGTMPYQPYDVGGAWRWTSTMGAAVSDDGVVYLLDLGHDGLANGRDWLATSSTGLYAVVSAVTWPTSTITGTSTTPPKVELAMWDTVAGAPAALSRDKTRTRSLVHATPGFTGSDTWTVAWQGGLPGLTGLDGQAQVNRQGVVQWIAIQVPTGRADRPFDGVGRLWDAAFAIQPAVDGLHIGDLVRVTAVREAGDGPKPVDASVEPAQARLDQYCPMGTFELEIEALLPPDPVNYPGGAVRVREPAWKAFLQPAVAFGAAAAGDATRADARCMARAASFLALPADATALATKPVNVTFLSGELLLTGLNFGYAGRPTTRAAAGSPFLVQHDASLTSATCPMLDGAALPASCDAACRAACEAQLLSRKARRHAYVDAQCATTDTECLARWDPGLSTTVNRLTFPNPGGPVLGLDLAWTLDERTATTLDLTDATHWPARGTLVSVITSGGQVVGGMTPKVSGVATGTLRPTGVAVWDRPDFTQAIGDHAMVFTSYPANLVMSFWTTSSNTDITLIR